MTKQELLKALSEKSSLPQTQVDAVLSALITVIAQHIKSGDELPISGLGKFATAQRAARVGRNPQTGEPLKIPAKRVPTFTFAKQIKDIATKK